MGRIAEEAIDQSDWAYWIGSRWTALRPGACFRSARGSRLRKAWIDGEAGVAMPGMQGVCAALAPLPGAWRRQQAPLRGRWHRGSPAALSRTVGRTRRSCSCSPSVAACRLDRPLFRRV